MQNLIGLLTATAFLMLLAPTPAEPNQFNETLFAITGASLIDGSDAEPISDAVVIIRKGLIECVGDRGSCELEPGTKTLDATGHWLVPGFIDSHVHWQVWYDNEGALKKEIAQNAANIYLANGVTTLIDVGGQRRVSGTNRRILEELQAGSSPAPRMLFSGWVDRREIDNSESKNAGNVTSGLLKENVAGIKIHNGLKPDDYELIVSAAKQAGRPVYGHTYYLSEKGFENYTAEAASAGINGIFHILGIPPLAEGFEPPMPDAPMEDWSAWWLAGAALWLHATEDSMDNLISLMLRQGTWLQPTLVTEQIPINPEYFHDHPNWVHSPMNREDLMLGMPTFDDQEQKQYQAAYAQMQKFVKRFHDAGGILVAGTDGLPIPGFGLQEEMRLLQEAGIPPLSVIQAATKNAAKAWAWQDRIGTLQKGKAADLVILAGNPLEDIGHTANIWRVVRAGVVYNPTTLLN